MTMTDSSAATPVLDRIGPGRPAVEVAPSSAVRVLLANSHGLVRAGFRLLLEATERITVVGEAADGEEAVALAHRLRPDVALIDATLPGLDRVHATRQIASRSRVAVILLIGKRLGPAMPLVGFPRSARTNLQARSTWMR